MEMSDISKEGSDFLEACACKAYESLVPDALH